jgi:hypothetical protein
MLKDQYGLFLYKCDRIACRHHRSGFDNERHRDQHLLDHDRPFKCSEAGCTFGQLGFKSERSLAQHIDDCHPGQKLSPVKCSSTQEIDPEGVEAVLTEAVKAGEVEFVSKYLGSIPEHLAGKLYYIALRSSTTAMVAQFVISGQSIDVVPLDDESFNRELTTPLVIATEACNLEVVKYLLTNGCECYKGGAVSTDGQIRYSRWKGRRGKALDHAIRIVNPQQRLEAIITLRDNGYNLINRETIRVWRGILSREKNESDCIIVKILEVLKHTLNKQNLSECLKKEAENKCSVEVGRWLLQNGAAVNTRGWNSSPAGGTPLYAACSKQTEGAAHFAKFLLESGADPTLAVGRRLPGNQKGARNISTWLGVTWEELVESTKPAHPPGGSVGQA